MFYALDLFPSEPCVTPGSTLSMVCNIRSNTCNKTSADLKFKFVFNDSSVNNRTRIAVPKSHVRIITATAVELNYPDIQQDFNLATVKCLVRDRNTSCEDGDQSMLLVGSEWRLVCISLSSAYLYCILHVLLWVRMSWHTDTLHVLLSVRMSWHTDTLHVYLRIVHSMHAYCWRKWEFQYSDLLLHSYICVHVSFENDKVRTQMWYDSELWTSWLK